MQFKQEIKYKKMHVIRMEENEDILLTLQKAIGENKIQNAIIISGLGSVKSFHYHVVASCENPPKEEFTKQSYPSDIVNINGLVMDGRIHSHIILSNKEKCYGGHLELGTVVLTFAVVVLLEVEESFKGLDSIGSYGI